MNEKFRFLSTLAIWGALTLVMVTMFASMAESRYPPSEMATIIMGVFVLMLTLMAGISTAQIWRGAGAGTDTQAAAEKAKRNVSGQVARLVDQLDEDEIVELETLLLTRQDRDVS